MAALTVVLVSHCRRLGADDLLGHSSVIGAFVRATAMEWSFTLCLISLSCIPVHDAIVIARVIVAYCSLDTTAFGDAKIIVHMIDVRPGIKPVVVIEILAARTRWPVDGGAVGTCAHQFIFFQLLI